MTTPQAQPPSPDDAARQQQEQVGTAIKNVKWIWAGLVIGIVVSFFMAPFVVRSLGPVYYGIWTLLNQVTGYLWLFDFGVRESVIKYVAQYQESGEHDELNSTVHAAVTLYSIICGVVVLAVGGLAFALPYFFNIPADSVGTARLTLIITGSTIALGFVFNVYAGVLMGLQRFYLVDRMGIVLTIPRTILIVTLLSAGYGVVALALITFLVSLAGNFIVYYFCRVHLPYLSFRFARPRREDLDRIIGYGKYVLVNNVGEKLVYASDGLVIGVFLPVASLTYFAIAGSLVGYLKSFVVAMASILNPMSSAMDSKKDDASLRALFLTSAKAAVLVGLPVCIGFIVLGQRFISLWMGPSFGPTAGQILVVLATAHMIGLPYYTITAVLYGLAKHRIVAWLRFAEAIANLTLSIVLVRMWGLIGVAVGTMIPHVVIAAIVLPAAVPKLLPVKLRDYYSSTYVKPLLASTPYWLVCLAIERYLAPSSLVTFIAAGVASLPFYLVPCWFLALSAAERQAVLGRIRRTRTPMPAVQPI